MPGSQAVDQPDINHLTPLHRATMADNSVAAKILLQWGADVLAENKDLRTPLKLAQYMAHNRTVEVLQQHARQEARAAPPRSWVVFKSPSPNSNETLCMLNRQRELTPPRPTAAPTATSSMYV